MAIRCNFANLNKLENARIVRKRKARSGKNEKRE